MIDYEDNIILAVSKYFPYFGKYDLNGVVITSISEKYQVFKYRDCTWESVDNGETWELKDWIITSNTIGFFSEDPVFKEASKHMKPGSPKLAGSNNVQPKPWAGPGFTIAAPVIYNKPAAPYVEISLEELREGLKAELRAELIAEERAKLISQAKERPLIPEHNKRKIVLE